MTDYLRYYDADLSRAIDEYVDSLDVEDLPTLADIEAEEKADFECWLEDFCNISCVGRNERGGWTMVFTAKSPCHFSMLLDELSENVGYKDFNNKKPIMYNTDFYPAMIDFVTYLQGDCGENMIEFPGWDDDRYRIYY